MQIKSELEKAELRVRSQAESLISDNEGIVLSADELTQRILTHFREFVSRRKSYVNKQEFLQYYFVIRVLNTNDEHIKAVGRNILAAQDPEQLIQNIVNWQAYKSGLPTGDLSAAVHLKLIRNTKKNAKRYGTDDYLEAISLGYLSKSLIKLISKNEATNVARKKIHNEEPSQKEEITEQILFHDGSGGPAQPVADDADTFCRGDGSLRPYKVASVIMKTFGTGTKLGGKQLAALCETSLPNWNLGKRDLKKRLIEGVEAQIEKRNVDEQQHLKKLLSRIRSKRMEPRHFKPDRLAKMLGVKEYEIKRYLRWLRSTMLRQIKEFIADHEANAA